MREQQLSRRNLDDSHAAIPSHRSPNAFLSSPMNHKLPCQSSLQPSSTKQRFLSITESLRANPPQKKDSGSSLTFLVGDSSSSSSAASSLTTSLALRLVLDFSPAAFLPVARFLGVLGAAVSPSAAAAVLSESPQSLSNSSLQLRLILL